jgi:hypothetical protein
MSYLRKYYNDELSEQEWNLIKPELITYSLLDTQSMVEIFKYLNKFLVNIFN